METSIATEQPPNRISRRPAVPELPPRRLLFRRLTSFVAAGGLLIYLALDGAGYDIVVRQQVAVVVWSVIAFGFAVGMFPRATPHRAVLIPLVPLGGLLLWMLLSFAWTESAERTTAELARLLNYAGLMTLALVSLNRHTFRAAAAGISVAALGIVGLAVASRLSPGTFPGANDVARLFSSDRLDYPLDYWNAIGAWGAMAAAIGVAWSAHARLTITRMASLAAVPVAGLAVYLSYSRGGVIGTAVALIAVLALSRNRSTALAHSLAAAGGTGLAILVVRDHEEIARATGGAGGGAVLVALVVAGLICAGAVLLTSFFRTDRLLLPRETARWAVPSFAVMVLVVLALGGHGPISNAWDEFRTQDQPASGPDPAKRLITAGGNRKDLWDSAFAAFKAHPLDGTGPGTFEFWWLREARNPEYVRDAHSIYLEQMAELGLPGLLLLVGFLGGSLGAALHLRGSIKDPSDIAASVAMCSAFVVFLVNAGVDWMWEETAVGALALGGIAIATAAGSSRLRSAQRRGMIGRPGLRGALVAAALLAAAVEVPGLVSTQRIRASESALRAGDVARAHQLADQAIDAEPWAASPYQQRAIVRRHQGMLESAASDLRSAESKESTNWLYPLTLSAIDAARGDRQKARCEFLRGRNLAPLLSFYAPFSRYGRNVYTEREIARILRRGETLKSEGDSGG